MKKNNFFLNWSLFVLFAVVFLRYYRGICGTCYQILKDSVVVLWWFCGVFVVFLWYSALRGRGTFGTPPYGVRGSQIPQRVLWYFASTRGKVFTTGFAQSGRFQKKLQQNVSEALFKNYLKLPRKTFSKNPFKFVLAIYQELFSKNRSEMHSIKFQRFFSEITQKQLFQKLSRGTA